MSSLTERIDAFLAAQRQPPAVTVSPDAAVELDRVRHALSGAFGEAIDVLPGSGSEAGALFALVPVRHLSASGIKLVETVCRARVGDRDPGQVINVLVGSPAAAQNAANRVAKPLGEGWKVTLDSFPCGTADPVGCAYFRLDRTG